MRSTVLLVLILVIFLFFIILLLLFLLIGFGAARAPNWDTPGGFSKNIRQDHPILPIHPFFSILPRSGSISYLHGARRSWPLCGGDGLAAEYKLTHVAGSRFTRCVSQFPKEVDDV